MIDSCIFLNRYQCATSKYAKYGIRLCQFSFINIYWTLFPFSEEKIYMFILLTNIQAVIYGIFLTLTFCTAL